MECLAQEDERSAAAKPYRLFLRGLAAARPRPSSRCATLTCTFTSASLEPVRCVSDRALPQQHRSCCSMQAGESEGPSFHRRSERLRNRIGGRNSARVQPSSWGRRWHRGLGQAEEIAPPIQNGRRAIPSTRVHRWKCPGVDELVVGRQPQARERRVQSRSHRRRVDATIAGQEHENRASSRLPQNPVRQRDENIRRSPSAE